MDQLGITFVILVVAIAMMVVKRTEKIGWWLAGLALSGLRFGRWGLRQNITGGIKAMKVARQSTSFLADGFRMRIL